LQEELQDALLWFKAVVAIITGIVCGFHLDGASGLIAGVAAVIGLSTLFVQYYLRVDEEAYGGLTSLLLDSAYVAFAAFLVRIYAFQFSVYRRHRAFSFHAFIQPLRTLAAEGFVSEDLPTVQVSWTVTHSVLYGDELQEALKQARSSLPPIPPPDAITNIKEL
jgi:hypothetical protein